jgi:uncharacterized protein (DUF305 family)
VTSSTDLDTPLADPAAGRGAVRPALWIVIAAALLALAVAAGYAWGNSGRGGSATPNASSVDAGFAWDMTTHHTQAVVMANYARDHTDNSQLRVLAYDIETEQQFQIGEMAGWLDTWGLPAVSGRPQMAWMAGHGHLASDGLMPGMATPAEMSKLQTLSGRPLDVYFLQLMIRHHQGGLPMAQYGAEHARSTYVQRLAQSIVTAQSSEIVSMEQLLRQLGGAPLPAPSH